jgi:hypothetical protein
MEPACPFTRVTPRLSAAIIALMAAIVPACATPAPAGPPQEAQLARALAPPERLQPPESLPAPARALLHTRMASHAQDMGALMSAIMVLRYPEIEARARAIDAEIYFARTGGGQDEATLLNASLPPKLFALEAELRERARTLAGAADHLDAFAVANAYGQLSETCVKCHAAYRGGSDGK